MPRATIETQNIAQNADQINQRTDFRTWNAQQPKLIEGDVEPQPLMIEDNKPLVETRPNVPPPKEAAVPTTLSAPEVKDDVREWERGQGVVAGAEAQAAVSQQNNNELFGALPTHVMSPTPLKSGNDKESFQDRTEKIDDDKHGLKDRIVNVAEGVKDRVEGIWEGAKHRGEDLKDLGLDLKDKALGALHLQHTERQEKNNNQGMISDAEAVRIGKKFDISDDKDTLIESKHHLLGDVRSFVSHKWHELTHAPEGEEQEEIIREPHETPEWEESRLRDEHWDDAELRQSIKSRQFFETRRNMQLPPSPQFIPLRREVREIRREEPVYVERRVERPLSPREEPQLRYVTLASPVRETVVVEPLPGQPSFGERIRARVEEEGHLIARDRRFADKRLPTTSTDLYEAKFHPGKDWSIEEAEERERLRLARHLSERSGERMFDGIRHFVQDKWDALVHQDTPARVRSRAELNAEFRNAEDTEFVLRPRREASPVRQSFRRAESETKQAFRNAREDVKKGWYDVKEKAKDAKDDVKEGWHDVKGWTKDAADSAVDTAERIWTKAENAAERTVSGIEHALGADQAGPDIVQRMEMMDQENILDLESDRRVYGVAGQRFVNDNTSWWNRRNDEVRAPLFGSARPELLGIVEARPEIERKALESKILQERQNTDFNTRYNTTGFVEKPKERTQKTEKKWFSWNIRSRSPSPTRDESVGDRFSNIRVDNMEANVVEDIVAGAPVQRVSGEFPDSLHQNRAKEEIPIFSKNPNVREFRETEIPVHKESHGLFGGMRDFVSSKWTSFTGHQPTSPTVEKFETTPTRRLSRFERFENDVAGRIEKYEDKQIREAKKDWAKGDTAGYHSHASRAHAAENIAEKLRGTDEKENRSPTTPISPGYPV